MRNLPLEVQPPSGHVASRQGGPRQDQGPEVRLLRRNVRLTQHPKAAHDQQTPEDQGPRLPRLRSEVCGPARHGQPRQDRSRRQRGRQGQREVQA